MSKVRNFAESVLSKESEAPISQTEFMGKWRSDGKDTQTIDLDDGFSAELFPRGKIGGAIVAEWRKNKRGGHYIFQNIDEGWKEAKIWLYSEYKRTFGKDAGFLGWRKLTDTGAF